MKIIRSRDFTADRAWGALDIASMSGITTRLDWTDQSYRWHVNDGEEVFVVLDGQVETRYRENGIDQSTVLEAGDIFHASVGTEHVAHPVGEARILVVGSEGSARSCVHAGCVAGIGVLEGTRRIIQGDHIGALCRSRACLSAMPL